jgi:hypothetical protein
MSGRKHNLLLFNNIIKRIIFDMVEIASIYTAQPIAILLRAIDLLLGPLPPIT